MHYKLRRMRLSYRDISNTHAQVVPGRCSLRSYGAENVVPSTTGFPAKYGMRCITWHHRRLRRAERRWSLSSPPSPPTRWHDPHATAAEKNTARPRPASPPVSNGSKSARVRRRRSMSSRASRRTGSRRPRFASGSRPATCSHCASAGRQPEASDSEPAPQVAEPAAAQASVPVKERLFAHPDMDGARQSGGLDQVLDAKARWLGHRLHADVALALPSGLTLADAEGVANTLRRELLAHVPALRTANVTFGAPDMLAADAVPQSDQGHHHAPEPFRNPNRDKC